MQGDDPFPGGNRLETERTQNFNDYLLVSELVAEGMRLRDLDRTPTPSDISPGVGVAGGGSNWNQGTKRMPFLVRQRRGSF